jgi:hypothetical protein
MKNFIKKLTSRKFIVTAISAIAGLITLFVGNDEIVQTIASALMIVIPTIVYCITEGVIDSKSVKTITETVVDTAEKLGVDESKVEVIEQIGAFGEMLVDKNTEE